MKYKIKYLILIIFLIFFTILMITVPRVYFKIYDSKEETNYTINSLNLTKLYNNSLTNLEILKLLRSDNLQLIEMKEEIDENKYNNLMNNILNELKKINTNCATVFEKNFMNYNYTDATISLYKYYISNSNEKSVELTSFEFYGSVGEITALFNSETYTIYALNTSNYVNSQSDDIEDGTDVDISKEYYKYLDISEKNIENYGIYYSNSSISINASDIIIGNYDIVTEDEGE